MAKAKTAKKANATVENFNKEALILAVYESMSKNEDVNAKVTKKLATQFVDETFVQLGIGIEKFGKAKIAKFGTFSVRERAARTGRNPQTGEAMEIGASKNVGFKNSATLKALVGGGIDVDAEGDDE